MSDKNQEKSGSIIAYLFKLPGFVRRGARYQVGIAKEAGITKTISPHKIRHSSVTAALDATGGDVRSVQKLSRHSNLNTLMIYDDNRAKAQGKMTALLEDLV